MQLLNAQAGAARPRFDLAVDPGGYLWWYLDGISDDGRAGVTVIGFVGSVFSPYYASARRRPDPRPERHSAINIGLYGPDRDLWAMTERGERHMRRDADRFDVGPSSMRWEDGGLTVEIDEITVPIPRRLRGRIRLVPRALTGHAEYLDANGRHLWRPLAPVADIEVSFSKPALAWRGAGYLDMNHGSEPLEDGFRYWTWSRAPTTAGGGAVLYDAERRDGSHLNLALRFDETGRTESFTPPPRQPLATSGWRVPRSTRADAGTPPRVIRTLEDTPFYARSSVAARLDGEDLQMVHEALDLDRFASRWVQTLLPFRMPRVR
ncbi:MAG TPA: hypothetical protein VLA56_02310 [Pseudomonadales bacterium]|nr:hypothetical protein [Pseudomonadales bacterium]